VIELVIFDWDGTLMDSTARIVDCMRRAFRELGHAAPNSEDIRELIGLELSHTVATLAGGASAAQVAALAARYRLAYASSAGVSSCLFADVRPTLTALRSAGCRLAVATGKSRRGLQRAFDDTGVTHLFDASRCGDECAAKPAPHMVESILAELEVPASAALVVGDTEYDLAMAQAAGVAAAAVSYGAHSRARLSAMRPRFILDAMHELPPHVLASRRLEYP
jgi:phosphoglycolate phosphatase